MAVRSAAQIAGAGADRLARGQIRRPRRARHRRHLRPAGEDEVLRRTFCRSGARRARLRHARRRRARRRSRATARRPRSTAGGPTCTIPGWRIGCTGCARRRWCCGASRTASSRPLTASSLAAALAARPLRADRAGRALSADRAARRGRRRDRTLRSHGGRGDEGLAFQRDGLSPGVAASRRIPTAS